MSTRSLICIQKGNEIDTKYCHWDGYPSNNGVLLFENYKEEHEVEELLVNDEYISSLGATVEDHCLWWRTTIITSYSREDNIQLFLEEDLINDADNCWAGIYLPI